jgi:alpha-glucosidase
MLRLLRLCPLLATSVFAAAPALAQGRVERLTFTAGGSYMAVEVKRDDLVHFEVGRLPMHNPQQIWQSPMLIEQTWPGPSVFQRTAQGLRTADISVVVDQATLCVRVADIRRNFDIGSFCPQSLDQAWKVLSFNSPVTAEGYGLGQYFHEPAQPDGNWIGRVWDPLHDSMGNMLRGFAGGANDFSMFPVFYGLGAGKQNYGIFFDQVYKQMWDFRSRPFTIGSWGDQMRWLVFTGSDLPELRRKYMQLTGKPPVPPRRAFGLWVSEFGYSNWNEVDRELADLRAAGFPLDGFAMDLQWFGGTFGDPLNSRMGSLTWDERHFPAPAEKIRTYREQHGVRLMLIEEPYISDLLTEHRALADGGHLARDCETCGPTRLIHNPWWGYGGMVDFTSPGASDFWHDFRRQPLYRLGIRDHWLDLGEPEQYNVWAWYHGFPELGKHAHPDIHNIYNFRWVEGIRRGYERNQNEERPFILSRSGTSGIQRFGAAIWSGDIGTNWANVRAQMHTQMQMALSGVDYYGSDAGGFQRSRGGVEGGTESLYTQWFAYSALFDVPVRPHSWNLDKERSTSPAKRGDVPSNLANIRLRYELLPYYYSLAYRAWLDGEAMFPPAFYYDQDDPQLRGQGHLKMIGRELLAATTAGHFAVAQDVYLPKGGWYAYQSGEFFGGDRAVTVSGFPLRTDGRFRLPLFARAGAIIPVQDPAPAGSVRSGVPPLSLKVFAGGSSEFTLYEDDGVTVRQAGGAYAATTVTQVSAATTTTVSVRAASGTFSGFPADRPVTLEIIRDRKLADQVELNGVVMAQCAGDRPALPCYRHAAANRLVIQAGSRPVRQDLQVQVTYRDGEPPRAWVQLVCENGETTPGTSVYAVGSSTKLGAWNTDRAVRLTPAAYPLWTAIVGDLDPGDPVEWKCVKKMEASGQVIQWESGSNNIFTAGSGFSGTHTGSF